MRVIKAITELIISFVAFLCSACVFAMFFGILGYVAGIISVLMFYSITQQQMHPFGDYRREDFALTVFVICFALGGQVVNIWLWKKALQNPSDKNPAAARFVFAKLFRSPQEMKNQENKNETSK